MLALNRFEVFSHLFDSETYRVLLFVLSYHPLSLLFELGICMREFLFKILILILIAIKLRHTMELPLSGINLDNSIVHTCTEVDIHNTYIIIPLSGFWCSGYCVVSSTACLLSESLQIQAQAHIYAFLALNSSISCHIFCFFSDKLKPMIFWYFILLRHFPSWVG